ncbi:MAG: heptosyltransferase-2 [Planctomycetota bacterium]|jgi:heptosyltransferase-2
MVKRIFVRGPNWVGDVVMATPILESLRDRFPGAEIHLGLRPYALPLMIGHPAVDAVHPLPGRGLGGIRQNARFLRSKQYDLAILLTNSFGSALEAFLARIPRRRGYVGDGRRLLLTEAVKPLMDDGARLPVPMAKFYFRVIEGLGCVLGEAPYTLTISTADQEFVDQWLAKRAVRSDSGPIVGLNPGAKFGASKLWAADRFAALGDRLVREKGATVILLGGPGEENLLNQIAQKMNEDCLNSAEEIIPLSPLKAMVDRLDLLVTNDTGPRSIAQAQGTPAVVLMGPTHPGWTDLHNDQSVILRHDVICGPCHKKICDLDHRCMTMIEVDHVFDASISLLSS